MIFDFILWLIYGPSPRSIADPHCPTCSGKGQYGGLRAFPGDPSSGLAPIKCACITYEARPENRPWVKKRQRRRQQEAERRAQREAEREAYLSWGIESMHAEPAPDPDREERIRQWQWTGEATLCCRRLECDCGQNARWINGRAWHIPGRVLPGSPHALYLERVRNAPDLASAAHEVDKYVRGANADPHPPASAGRTYSLLDRRMEQWEVQNANAPTDQLPAVGPP